jgi:hypothetical protein
MNKPNINKKNLRGTVSLWAIAALLTCFGLAQAAQAVGQCTEIASGLNLPVGTALTNFGNLLVSESGTGANDGRINIIDRNGNRQVLIDGLPSGLADVGDPSGAAGMVMVGRDLYVAIGSGDVDIFSSCPCGGTNIPNPNGPSSPIFSTILVIHFNTRAEPTGFTLTMDDQQALANGQTVTLSNSHGDTITIRVVVNFPDYIPFPLDCCPENVKHSNPYHLVAVGDTLYVTDGGRNLVWQVDLPTQSYSELVNLPDIPNPLFPDLGGPFLEAVPTGIASLGNQLLVTPFRGFPFPTGVSTVEQVDRFTGNDTTLISGLTSAIDVLPIAGRPPGPGRNYLVLQFCSEGPFFNGPGLALRFNDAAGLPTLIADCLTQPTSMTLNKRTGTLYVSQYDGRVFAIRSGLIGP